MRQFNFVIKYLIIILIGINYFSCSKKDAPIIDGVFQYISDSLVHSSCCDTILITTNYEFDVKNQMMYLPNIFLENLKVDTNIFKNQENRVTFDNKEIFSFFKNRSYKPIYINTIPFREYPLVRPKPDHKLTLVLSDLFCDLKNNGIIFVTLITNNTKTFMLVLQKRNKHFYVEKVILLDGFFPWK